MICHSEVKLAAKPLMMPPPRIIIERITMTSSDLDPISDAAAAAAFRRLVAHLRHRHDAQNIDLMGLAGFCRNCLADWVMEATQAAGGQMTRDEAREAVHGMPMETWKERYQTGATPEQVERMAASVAKNQENFNRPLDRVAIQGSH